MKPLSKKATNKQAAPKTFSPFDEAPIFPEGKPKVEYRPYRCLNCGHEQMISTNHLGKVIDYCKECSWKPSFGNPEYAVPFNGRTYRPFEYAGPTDRTVTQTRKVPLSKKAGPDTMGPGVSPMGGGGAGGGGAGMGGPSLLGGAPGPEGLGHWKCKFPDCARQFGNGQDFRDHLHQDHGVKDIG